MLLGQVRKFLQKLTWPHLNNKLYSSPVRGPEVHPREIDISNMPIRQVKASHHIRDPYKTEYIVLHITGVTGGFGTRSSVRDRWRQLLDKHTWPDDLKGLKAQIDSEFDLKTTDKDLLSVRLATWERYRDTPYHMIIDQDGNIIWNRNLKTRTYHAGKGNDGVGFAIDCGVGETLPTHVIKSAQDGLIKLQRKLRCDIDDSPVKLTAHRCFSRKKPMDPGAYIWKNVVCPLPKDLKVVSFGLFLPDGRPIPKSWDERSPFKG